MLATPCRCINQLVFADEPDTCQRCGRRVTVVGASTADLATAIAEVAAGHRRLSHPMQGSGVRRLGTSPDVPAQSDATKSRTDKRA